MTELELNNSRICIVMMSALGDTVHVLPVICALKRHAPSCHITWVLEPPGAALMRGHPYVDEILVHERGVRGLIALRRKLRGRRFDLVIDLQVALKAGLTTLALPAEVKLGFDRARARDANWLFTNRRIPGHAPQHVQEQYLEFLEYLGVDPHPLKWELGPWPGEEGLAEPLLRGVSRPVVSLVLATTWEEKDWYPDRWAALAQRLHEEEGVQPVLVGGKSEKERAIANVVVRDSGVPIVSTLGCGLRELVAVLRRSALVISPDTAPMHMSVALGRPVIGMMGYTNPRRVGPYRGSAELLVDAYSNPGELGTASLEYRTGRMASITVDMVLEKVRAARLLSPTP